MRKTIIFIIFAPVIFIAALAACSGYFNNQTDPAKTGVLNLALSDGSGYISSDNYNETTPFIYRGGGKAWLFFASDCPGIGGYDIYYAEMDASGKFGKPVMMDTNINTISNEISPVVFKGVLMGTMTNIYISFLRTLNSGTNIVTYRLNTSFQTASAFPENTISSIPAIDIGLLSSDLMESNKLIVCSSTSSFIRYTYNGSAGLSWSSNDSITNISLTSISGYAKTGNPIEFYISADNNSQLTAFALDQKKFVKNFSMSAQSSSFKDTQPFVDTGDGFKIYFASDRFGKGNYDLYRYNTKTYDIIAGNLGLILAAPVLYSDNISSWWSPPSIVTPNLNWSTVFGADGYEIYQYKGYTIPSGPMDYTLLNRTGATNYSDPDGSTWSNQLWYMIVATNSTQRSGFSNPIGNLHYYN